MAINAYSWAKDGEKNLSPSFKVRPIAGNDGARMGVPAKPATAAISATKCPRSVESIFL